MSFIWSERILAQREGTTIEKKFEQDIRDIPQGITGETKVREVKTRVNQNVFRQIVLGNYDGKCTLTGIDLSELLVASHIILKNSIKAIKSLPEQTVKT